eukprot:TRINITY_DN32953_c0_g1_i1.p1 TRINITY_DN32953_c0_g1~~TRINITY_DN32953_c0_g1_i1.p1  ORF type:complete len:208 (+),score=23.98 TRINITY_DN32953_c0_g1_i1:128-751(+)
MTDSFASAKRRVGQSSITEGVGNCHGVDGSSRARKQAKRSNEEPGKHKQSVLQRSTVQKLEAVRYQANPCRVMKAIGSSQSSLASTSMRGYHKVTHTVTVPHPSDPKLWCIKTFGPEAQLCISLMWKSFKGMLYGKDPPIHSVFYSSHLRGYMYIEAYKESDVKDFVKGIQGISQASGFTMVPVTQMPFVFTASQQDAKRRGKRRCT